MMPTKALLRSTAAPGGEADELLVAIGRRPNTADLGLEAVCLTPEPG
jgi:pyruvate/2-oxoglutarate dehydrogenase complex dihydrolipoamide dehydrogenase (E3) component